MFAAVCNPRTSPCGGPAGLVSKGGGAKVAAGLSGVYPSRHAHAKRVRVPQDEDTAVAGAGSAALPLPGARRASRRRLAWRALRQSERPRSGEVDREALEVGERAVFQ